MKLQQWQQAYPTATEYYDAFHDSQEGQRIWQLAYSAMEQDDEGDEDDPLDTAHDIVIDGMEDWLLHDVDDSEYDNASAWFETLRDDLSEGIFAGLT